MEHQIRVKLIIINTVETILTVNDEAKDALLELNGTEVNEIDLENGPLGKILNEQEDPAYTTEPIKI